MGIFPFNLIGHTIVFVHKVQLKTKSAIEAHFVSVSMYKYSISVQYGSVSVSSITQAQDDTNFPTSTAIIYIYISIILEAFPWENILRIVYARYTSLSSS